MSWRLLVCIGRRSTRQERSTFSSLATPPRPEFTDVALLHAGLSRANYSFRIVAWLRRRVNGECPHARRGSTTLAPVHHHAIRKHLNRARPLRQHLHVNRAISPHPGETIWTGRAPVVGYERSIKRACEHSGQKDGCFGGRADMSLTVRKQRPRTVRLEAERANSDVRFWG